MGSNRAHSSVLLRDGFYFYKKGFKIMVMICLYLFKVLIFKVTPLLREFSFFSVFLFLDNLVLLIVNSVFDMDRSTSNEVAPFLS